MNHRSELLEIFCARCLRPWLFLPALQYFAMYFRFCRWCHVFI